MVIKLVAIQIIQISLSQVTWLKLGEGNIEYWISILERVPLIQLLHVDHVMGLCSEQQKELTRFLPVQAHEALVI